MSSLSGEAISRLAAFGQRKFLADNGEPVADYIEPEESYPPDDTNQLRVAALAELPTDFVNIGTGFYRQGHAVWELRIAEDGQGGYVLTRKREERLVDLRDNPKTASCASCSHSLLGRRVAVIRNGQAVPMLVIKIDRGGPGGQEMATVQDENGMMTEEPSAAMIDVDDADESLDEPHGAHNCDCDRGCTCPCHGNKHKGFEPDVSEGRSEVADETSFGGGGDDNEEEDEAPAQESNDTEPKEDDDSDEESDGGESGGFPFDRSAQKREVKYPELIDDLQAPPIGQHPRLPATLDKTTGPPLKHVETMSGRPTLESLQNRPQSPKRAPWKERVPPKQAPDPVTQIFQRDPSVALQHYVEGMDGNKYFVEGMNRTPQGWIYRLEGADGDRLQVTNQEMLQHFRLSPPTPAQPETSDLLDDFDMPGDSAFGDAPWDPTELDDLSNTTAPMDTFDPTDNLIDMNNSDPGVTKNVRPPSKRVR